MAKGLTGGGAPGNLFFPKNSYETDWSALSILSIRPASPDRRLPVLSFRAVNRQGAPGYDPGLQRHHILPKQLVSQTCFSRLFEHIGRKQIGFDDFRRNGLLLPADDRTARVMGLPLHRGPHQDYNRLVIARVGQIEAHWANARADDPDRAGIEALFRLQLLQQALRKRLLDPRGRPVSLNRSDPAHREAEFYELDAMAELLWADSAVSQ